MGSFWIILLILAIVISKGAGKKIAQAGKVTPQIPVTEDDGEEVMYEGPAAEPELQMQPEELELQMQPEEPELPVEPDAASELPPALSEEEAAFRDDSADDIVQIASPEPEKKKKLEIDPKKMVIYSEIFRPKYDG